MSRFVDLTGQRFGRLTVVQRVEDYISPKGERKTVWLCCCDCGNTVPSMGCFLVSGKMKSCGCLRNERIKAQATVHGRCKTRLYRIWCGMKARCCNSKNSAYQRYGGRGITICDEWRNDFMTFHRWAMANGYQEGLSIDRINNDEGYNPENCQWATITQQNRNKRNLHYVTLNGETKAVAEWCEQYNLSQQTVHNRLKYGWSPEEALGIIPRK